MKKMWKKAIAMLLVVIMISGAAPLGALVDMEWLTVRANAESYSGTCGEHLTWELDPDTGDLSITGTGDMSDYSYGDGSGPWSNELVHNVTIGNGVTSIGACAFHSCPSMISITISDSVTKIGDAAFAFCKSLKHVTIPSSVTNLGETAFYYCTSLTDVIIQNGLTTIVNSAFYNCSTLTRITIPDSVTDIDNYAFVGCTSLASIAIPDSVVSIGEGAFGGCTGLEQVVLGRGVSHIGSMAFSSCVSLTNLIVPNSVTMIDDYAFAGVCNIVYNGSASGSPWGARCMNGYVNGCLVYESIEQKALCACSAATTGDVSLPSGLTSIGYSAFVLCTKVTSVTIPDSVTSIGNNAFSCCTSLTNIIIPDKVTTIGANTFNWCASLSTLTIGRGVMHIEENAFLLHLEPRLLSILLELYDEWRNEGITQYEGIPLDELKKLLDHPNGCLTDVYYNGIQPQLSAIEIDEGNEDFLSATIHYVGVAPMIAAKDAVVGCSAGRLVKVRVDIHNPGIIATRLHIGYDAQQLRLVNVENGTVFEDSTFLAGENLAAEPYALLWSDDTAQADNTSDGTLVTLVFEVQSSASTGDSEITVAIDEDSTFNASLQLTHLYAVSGTVHIVDCMPGDASSEGKISLLDSVMISRYLAGGWNMTINEINSDVNGDGNVNLKDVVLIRRFLAGWNVELI